MRFVVRNHGVLARDLPNVAESLEAGDQGEAGTVGEGLSV